jgi:XRE family aerobic/anaerobic benzoate catabolism transcriptional regulator
MNDLRRILESRAAFYAKADEVFETSGRTVEDSFVALKAQLETAIRLAA